MHLIISFLKVKRNDDILEFVLCNRISFASKKIMKINFDLFFKSVTAMNILECFDTENKYYLSLFYTCKRVCKDPDAKETRCAARNYRLYRRCAGLSRNEMK